MVFNSLSFLVFFILVLGVYHLLPLPWRVRKIFLVAVSYLFYAAWNPPFVALLWLSTGVDFYLAHWLDRTQEPRARRLILIGSLGLNLGLLGFFKYGGFMAENWNLLTRWLGVDAPVSSLNVILPLGISFYTFETISYIVDVYRRQIKPSDSMLDYALFIAFFPHLVAGPIVRAGDFLPQCLAARRASPAQLGWGLSMMAVGLFQKMILADWLLAPVADQVFSATRAANFVEAWTGSMAFAAQVFCDFAGYSTCGIGAALCLGFVLNDNFRSPYGAIGFSEFWRRWHISLSSWLRDYIYIPLGGNRGSGARLKFNLFATMVLGGLWHGAAWHFIIFGAMQGFLLVSERSLKRLGAGAAFWASRAGQLGLMLATFLVFNLTLVFFRALNMTQGGTLAKTMLLGGSGQRIGLETATFLSVAATVAILLTAHASLKHLTLEGLVQRTPWWSRAAIITGLLLSLLFAPGDERAFIYFQF